MKRQLFTSNWTRCFSRRHICPTTFHSFLMLREIMAPPFDRRKAHAHEYLPSVILHSLIPLLFFRGRFLRDLTELSTWGYSSYLSRMILEHKLRFTWGLSPQWYTITTDSGRQSVVGTWVFMTSDFFVAHNVFRFKPGVYFWSR